MIGQRVESHEVEVTPRISYFAPLVGRRGECFAPFRVEVDFDFDFEVVMDVGCEFANFGWRSKMMIFVKISKFKK